MSTKNIRGGNFLAWARAIKHNFLINFQDKNPGEIKWNICDSDDYSEHLQKGEDAPLD